MKPHLEDRIKVCHNQLLSEEIADHCQYGKTKCSIVIFLCTSDYFGMGKDVYRFKSREEDYHNSILNEKSLTIFYEPGQ